jgi:hypothetical protein
MRHEPQSNSNTSTRPGQGDAVVVLGGHGGLASRYREVVEARGLSLQHYEQRVPRKAKSGSERIALVVVMVTMVSHNLAASAATIAAGARLVYLKSPSVSALRAAVDEVCT